MANKIKVLISKNKRRFREDGFDLDLSYITRNIIAMGFPAEKLEGVYRNHIDDVVKFLEHRHKGRYKIYNLCSERSYDKTKFHGPISDYPFNDHHPPPFEIIEDFCKDVANWFADHEDNIAVVHCKAGKGRTGVMICAYLLHMKQRCKDANEALHYYSLKRTMDDKGVTIPSQRRYVYYYDEFLRSGLEYSSRQLLLHAIKFETLPFSCSGNCALLFNILSHKQLLFQSEVYEKPKKSDHCLVMPLKRPLPISDDICIEFFNKPKMMKKEKMLHFWFNTLFVGDEEVFTCDQPCGAHDTDSAAICPVHHFSAPAVEAHRQREQFQSQMMEHLSQLSQQQQQQQQQNLETGSSQMAPSHCEVRLSWRFMDKYQEYRMCGNNGGSSSSSSSNSSLLTSAVSSVGNVKATPTEDNNVKNFLTLTLKKTDLDKANKDKQHKLFTEDFAVKLFFTTPDVRASTFPLQMVNNLESNKSKNATSLEAVNGRSDVTDSAKETISSDDDYSYDASLSETDDEDCDDDDDDNGEDSKVVDYIGNQYSNYQGGWWGFPHLWFWHPGTALAECIPAWDDFILDSGPDQCSDYREDL